MSVYERIQAWEKDNKDNFERCLSWAMYNETGGAFNLSMPGVREGKFTPGDEFKSPFKRSLLSKAVGLSNEPGDSGGFTKFGVAQNAHRDLDVRNLDFEGAKTVYRNGYWKACRCDDLPYSVAFQVFDAACGSGPKQGIVLLQRALGVSEDGVFGPATLAAVQKTDERSLAERYSKVRCDFAYAICEHKPSQKQFLPGWLRRWKVLQHGEKE